MKKQKIPFVDLTKDYQEIKKELRIALDEVFASGTFILGAQVARFEKEFAQYLESPYAIGVASGSDAITLSLKALGLGIDDEVLIPVNSYPTAFAVAAAGVSIRIVDIEEDTYTIDPIKLEGAISKKTKAVVVVHLYGQAVDLDPIMKLTKKHKLFLIEDVAQAHGALYKGEKLGTFGDFGCFSFYPSKNLGAFGDGGMIVTKNKTLYEHAKRLRMYGEEKRYESKLVSTHSRLDEIQAAMLLVKLKKLALYNKKRQVIAKEYKKHLRKLPIVLPKERFLGIHVFYLFVIKTAKREGLKHYLRKHGVETGIHFPIPIHLVKAFKHLGYKKGAFPIAERVAREILSLPCYPQLSKRDVNYIATLVKNFITK